MGALRVPHARAVYNGTMEEADAEATYTITDDNTTSSTSCAPSAPSGHEDASLTLVMDLTSIGDAQTAYSG